MLPLRALSTLSIGSIGEFFSSDGGADRKGCKNEAHKRGV